MSEDSSTAPNLLNSCLANCTRYWLGYGLEIRQESGVSLHRSGVDFPLLNGVLRVDDPRPEQIAAARLKLAGIASTWWVGPDSHPSTLEALLGCGGTLQGSMPVYVRSLGDLPEMTAPEGVSIDEIKGGAALDEWVECCSPSMGVPNGQVGRMKLVERGRSDHQGCYRRFAARLDGRIVGTSAMLSSDGVAGVYLCSTSQNFRSRGIGAALTAAAARAGLEHGLDHATLQATPMGEPLYRRLGFWKLAEYRCVMFTD